MTGLTYYEVLDVPPTATSEEIKRAYLDAVKATHPDRIPGASDRFFRLAREAYEILGDPTRRADYDRALATTADTRPPGPTPTPTQQPRPGTPARGRAENPTWPTEPCMATQARETRRRRLIGALGGLTCVLGCLCVLTLNQLGPALGALGTVYLGAMTVLVLLRYRGSEVGESLFRLMVAGSWVLAGLWTLVAVGATLMSGSFLAPALFAVNAGGFATTATLLWWHLGEPAPS